MFWQKFSAGACLLLALMASFAVAGCGGGGGGEGGGGSSVAPTGADRVVIATNLDTININEAISPAIQVELRDGSGNLVQRNGVAVSLELGINAGNATLSGTLTRSTVGGVATFNDIQLDAVGSGYALRATSNGLQSGLSTVFSAVDPNQPESLQIVSSPSAGLIQDILSPAFSIQLLNHYGDPIANDGVTVTASLATNPNFSTLSGTTTKSTQNGIVTFDDLMVDKSGTGYVLKAEVAGVPSVNSPSFDMSDPAEAAQVHFKTQPSQGDVGQTISPAIQVELRNTLGVFVPVSGVDVEISLSVNPGSSILSGTKTQTTVNGIATFDDLSLNNVGSGYVLLAEAPRLTSELSTAFDIIDPWAPASLNVMTQSNGAIESYLLSPDLEVEVLDSFGNRVTDSSLRITASIGSNPGGGTLTGTKSVNAVNGVATFSNLRINEAGAGYTLEFSGDNVTSGTSDPFDVTDQIFELSFQNVPGLVTEEEVISPGFEVHVKDQTGALQPNFQQNVVLSLDANTSSASLSGTLAKIPTNGIATFNNVYVSDPGTGFFFEAQATSAVSATSSSFDVRSLAAASADPKTTFTTEDLQHMLTRTQWGWNEQTLSDVQNSLSVHIYIDNLVNKQTDPTIEAYAETNYLGRSDVNFPARADISRWWEYLMMKTDNPFREVMAFFWHDHFALSTEAFGTANLHFVPTHINILRDQYAGNFRQMLYDISVDPAMLRWLDGIQSRVNRINENYARELWELFTLGVDNGYTQADIEEAARCLTGFRERNNPLTGMNYTSYYEPWHDTGDKTVFGITIPGRTGADGVNEYWDLIDLTLNNKPVEDFVCRKLCEYFIYPDPEEDLVAEFGKTFRANNWELEPVLKQMFKSKAFYSAKAKDGIVKSPVDFAMGFFRATGMEVRAAPVGGVNIVEYMLIQAGQVPTQPINVNGWPGGEVWLSADNMVQRNFLLYYADVEQAHQASIGFDIASLLPGGSNTAEEVVDHLAEKLMVPLTTEHRDALIEYLNTDMDTSENVIADPWDTSNTTQLNKKLRGLVYILAQLPGYQLR